MPLKERVSSSDCDTHMYVMLLTKNSHSFFFVLTIHMKHLKHQKYKGEMMLMCQYLLFEDVIYFTYY
jgi:hypothetical protein